MEGIALLPAGRKNPQVKKKTCGVDGMRFETRRYMFVVSLGGYEHVHTSSNGRWSIELTKWC